MTEKTLKKKELKDEKFGEIVEPENISIITEKDERFVIDSPEEATKLLNRLDTTQYHKELAKFILTPSNDIKDLTKK